MPSIVFFLISGLPWLDFSLYLPATMLLLQRSAARPSGFIEPCRPRGLPGRPSGPLWIHEIKHDGFRLMVRREGARLRLNGRGGGSVISSPSARVLRGNGWHLTANDRLHGATRPKDCGFDRLPSRRSRGG